MMIDGGRKEVGTSEGGVMRERHTALMEGRRLRKKVSVVTQYGKGELDFVIEGFWKEKWAMEDLKDGREGGENRGRRAG